MRNPLLLNHYVIHEFMHLEMAIAASKRGQNKISYSSKEQTDALMRKYFVCHTKLSKQVGDEKATEIMNQMINGMLLQVVNCGLDILVEQKIFKEHKIFRPLQLLSISQMLKENIESLDKVLQQIGSLFPPETISVNRTLNYVTATLFKDMYKVDYTKQIKLTPNEKKIADNIITEAGFYINEGYEAGEEYNLLSVVAEEVSMDNYLTIVNEDDFEVSESEKLIDRTKKAAKLHPLEQRVSNSQQFLENQGKDATENMMMSMYMLGAMQEMDNFSFTKVRNIAMEIAMVGVNGINPNNNGYKIPSLGSREFGGYEFLAWYYVSWARAIPEKLSALRLPFAEAYEAALQLYNKKS